MEKIYVSGPWITQKEIDYVADAAKNAWYDKANMYNERFETAFAQYVGRKYAIALPSCTSGLHLALLALGIHEGDEVIVPDVTWIATAAPISYVGAKPVMVDIEETSWCMSSEAFEAAITARTKAVIFVDLYGNMPNIDAILEIAKKYKLAVIEDAAEAIGSKYKGKLAGSFGDFSVFSFHGSKTMTTGEGGMLLCNDEKLYEKCLFYRDHGRKPGDKMFFNAEIGYKYKMSSLQAALGLAQLERVDELVARKRMFFNMYQAQIRFLKLEGVQINKCDDDVFGTYWMNSIVLSGQYQVTAEELIQEFARHHIDTRCFFHPLSAIPAYAFLRNERYNEKNPISYRITKCALNLPSGFDLNMKKIKRVCSCLEEILNKFVKF